jgi:hypothetical protein
MENCIELITENLPQLLSSKQFHSELQLSVPSQKRMRYGMNCVTFNSHLIRNGRCLELYIQNTFLKQNKNLQKKRDS